MPSLEQLFVPLPESGAEEPGSRRKPVEPLVEPLRSAPPQNNVSRPAPSSPTNAQTPHSNETHPNPLQSSPTHVRRLSDRRRKHNAEFDFDLVGSLQATQRIPEVTETVVVNVNASGSTHVQPQQRIALSCKLNEPPNQSPAGDTISTYRLSPPKDVLSPYGSPITDPGTYPESDIWSPCFSAFSANSNEGMLTPYRLSGGPLQSALISEGVCNHKQALDHVTGKLESLNTSADAERRWTVSDRSVFTGYALPEPEADVSVHSLGKPLPTTLDERPSRLYSPLPSFLEHREGDESFADDIFSELGYLSGSIS